jgi:hypothetical protein
MHDRVHFVVTHCRPKLRRIVNVADDERGGVTSSLVMPGGEIVEDDDRGPLGAKRLYRMTSDVAGAASNKDSAHGRPIEK